ncbi:MULTISPECIES: HAD-IA family hydrolase [unclassified Streptomyces]|uniref:HAD-IA family hydrolase n=1 Tax=unclassified Streptomyces TaxID=2593676 RepID=UPI001371724B|nr:MULTISPECIES: HAD-IA family hydrolase [unclassified Streptomyces]NEA03248.1 HAD-IA family hydrolase [Streptomyces sp. SID10116]MYY86669.1 HAD-IA family hydrolase [Streptomyces sp. SID335]MYZ12746.1 HAD-IA family hydrolase [Streptomyces sp. SID337]NDZ91640.1 HAD-IA family hydrolase [Streptomyces sp. SID10115]NEB45887.1 HAD-IA family hydrolase [Streptomyces sp. SID339]
MTSRGRAFDAVLTDLDGVIRFYEMAELEELERSAGLPAGSTAEIAFRPETDMPLMRGEITRQRWIESIADGLADRVPWARGHELGTALAETKFRADDAVVGLLRRARAAGLRVLLVTNATPWLADDLALLGLTGPDGCLDDVISSADLGIAKPDRRIYETAAERAGVAPARCLFVDDRQENVDAAVALGMTGLLYGEPADLRAALAPLV